MPPSPREAESESSMAIKLAFCIVDPQMYQIWSLMSKYLATDTFYCKCTAPTVIWGQWAHILTQEQDLLKLVY